MSRGKHRLKRETPRSRPGDQVYALLLALSTGASGAFAASVGESDPDRPDVSPADSFAVAVNVSEPVHDQRSPTRIEIPAIAVSAEIEPLHRAADGTLTTPADWGRAGWYAEGVVPGDRGSAVIVGHRDSARDGPAVFYRLTELRQGDGVFVTSGDGLTERFVVDASRQVPKARFPTELVYGPRPTPELRLVTCTGEFDSAAGSYLDNLVVSAYAVS
jgi:sortase (surface protein transpeptidase)